MAAGHVIVTFRVPWNDYAVSQRHMEFMHAFLKRYGALAIKTADGELIVIDATRCEQRFQTMTFEALFPGSKEDVRVMIGNLFEIGWIPPGREWQVFSRCVGEDDAKSFQGEEV